MRSHLRYLALAAVSGIFFISAAGAEEKAVPLDKLPKVVSDAVTKMFPRAKLIEAIEEEEQGNIEYEVTIKTEGKKIVVILEPSGVIVALEKEISLKDLPKAVTEAIQKLEPKAVLKSAEAVYEIEDGKEVLEFYEVHFKTAYKKQIEVRLKADGTIVPDDDDEKDEKAKDKK